MKFNLHKKNNFPIFVSIPKNCQSLGHFFKSDFLIIFQFVFICVFQFFYSIARLLFPCPLLFVHHAELLHFCQNTETSGRRPHKIINDPSVHWLQVNVSCCCCCSQHAASSSNFQLAAMKNWEKCSSLPSPFVRLLILSHSYCICRYIQKKSHQELFFPFLGLLPYTESHNTICDAVEGKSYHNQMKIDPNNRIILFSFWTFLLFLIRNL